MHNDITREAFDQFMWGRLIAHGPVPQRWLDTEWAMFCALKKTPSQYNEWRESLSPTEFGAYVKLQVALEERKTW